MSLQVAAVDCGAESGRVMVADFNLRQQQVSLHEVHRFSSKIQENGGKLFWDWRHQSQEIDHGLGKACKAYTQLAGISFDTWGVDFLLLDANLNAIQDPRCYRDPRGNRGQQRLDAIMDREQRFQRSGVAQLAINTLDQLSAVASEEMDLLEQAKHLVFLPDHLALQHCGVINHERSICATAAATMAGAQTWDFDLLQQMGIPAELLGPISHSGRILGPVSSTIGCPAGCQVIASAGHDTAAAVAALPCTGSGVAYLSSGTWSLLGCIVEQPVISGRGYAAGFSNESHWNHQSRYNRNIMGLWIIQQCRRSWLNDGLDLSYPQLCSLAEESPDYPLILNVDDASFLAPSDPRNPMPQRIQNWFRHQGSDISSDPGSIVRAVLRGLAAAYAAAIRAMAQDTQQMFTEIVVLGGGSKNKLLNTFTADATGCRIVCGPNEASALGNALLQALALGAITAEELPVYASNYTAQML